MIYQFDRRVLQSLGLCSALATVFYAAGAAITGWQAHWYLLANLLLGYIPLLLTYPLLRSVRLHGSRDLRSIAWCAVWLGFLPNSFYILTDVMHLADRPNELSLLYAAMMFSLFAFVGMAIGFASLYFMHREMLRRLSQPVAYGVIELVLGLSSIGIYLGRVLRWNTWDVVIHPVALAQDVMAGLLWPARSSIMIILMFFALLSGLYGAIWWVCRPNTTRE